MDKKYSWSFNTDEMDKKISIKLLKMKWIKNIHQDDEVDKIKIKYPSSFNSDEMDKKYPSSY